MLLLSPGTLKAQESAATPQPPNFLIVLVDDVGMDSLEIFDVVGKSTRFPPMPHVEGLAKKGMMFRNVWSAPVCSPARAMLQTGCQAFRPQNGLGFNIRIHEEDSAWSLPTDNPATLPKALKAATGNLYQTAFFGKWHVANLPDLKHPNEFGYDHFAGPFGNLSRSYHLYTKIVNGEAKDHDVYAMTDKVNDTIDWIDAQEGPWMVNLSTNLVHAPFHEPPADLFTIDIHDPAFGATQEIRHFKAMLEAFDTELGRLLRYLEGRGDENTYVLFLSDNGTPHPVTEAPYESNHAKGSAYQGGVHVPMIVTGPGIAPGTENHDLVSFTDVLPTILELAGVEDLSVVPKAARADMVSFAGSLRGDPQTGRKWVMAGRFSPNGHENGYLRVPEDPPEPPICYEDLGYQFPKEGSEVVTLSICSERLMSATRSASLSLWSSNPDAEFLVLQSVDFHPRPIEELPGAFLVPDPESAADHPDTNVRRVESNGKTLTFEPTFFTNRNNNHQTRTVFVQAVSVSPKDGNTPLAVSNVVGIRMYSNIVKAIRNDRYKLILRFPDAGEELYDLETDPLETSNLLELGVLSKEARSARKSLRRILFRVVPRAPL